MKSEIRQIIKSRKRQFTEQQLRELSLTAINKVADHSKVKDAKTIFLYYSMADEVFTHELVDELTAEGKTVLLPRMINKEEMVLVRYNGEDSLREAGKYHILEPQGEPYTYYNKVDVAIVPGVAFTKDGKRMGHGRGYYDRMLPKLANAYKIGICFQFQIMDDIPTDKYDIKMDEVIF